MTKNTKAGRPAKEIPDDATPAQKAIGNLQYAMDRACASVADANRTSYAARATAAAHAGVARDVVEQGLAHIEAAVDDAKEAIRRAYEEPQKTVGPARRAVLGA